MYLKQKNDYVERLLEEKAEPLNVICRSFGAEYPAEKLSENWKLLLKNHPHDSICGVSIDDVHSDMEERFEQSEKLADGIIACAAGKLTNAADTSAFGDSLEVFTLFNTVANERTAQVFLPCAEPCVAKDAEGNALAVQATEGGIIAEVKAPAMGICSVGLYKGEPAKAEAVTGNIVENSVIKAEFNADGSINLTDKRNGKTYNSIGYLEECADTGDEYNYSFMTNDVPLTTLGNKADIEIVESGALRTVVKVSRVWALPSSLSADRSTRSAETTDVPVVTYVTITKDSPVLTFKTVIRNRCRDHRIRAMFPTGVKTDVSYAQTQFDITTHPIHPATFDNSTIPENVKRIIIGARESLPITQFPQRDFAAVCDDKSGAAVINRGLPEYEVLPENTTIALTLFRSIGWLTRFDLNTRIGDAGPEIFVPDAQCLRDMEFTYGFCPLDGTVEASGLPYISQCFNNELFACKNTVHAGEFKTLSLAEIKGSDNLRITAVKEAQDKNGVIVRLYNASSEKQRATLTFGGLNSAYLCNLAEQNEKALEVNGSEVTFTAEPKAIYTIRLDAKVNAVALKEGNVTPEKAAAVKADFTAYPIPEVVTDADVAKEEKEPTPPKSFITISVPSRRLTTNLLRAKHPM